MAHDQGVFKDDLILFLDKEDVEPFSQLSDGVRVLQYHFLAAGFVLPGCLAGIVPGKPLHPDQGFK